MRVQSQTTPEIVVAAARGMIGTPFAHQGRLPGEALDCVGLLVAVGRECGLCVEDETTYPRETDGEALERCLRAACRPIPIDDVDLSDILIFLRGRSRWHGGIISRAEPLTMIHAWSRFTGGRVREELVGEEWFSRIHGAWRYREE